MLWKVTGFNTLHVKSSCKIVCRVRNILFQMSIRPLCLLVIYNEEATYIDPVNPKSVEWCRLRWSMPLLDLTEVALVIDIV